jgi:UDP-N-acetyl-D-mannosaminuronic acid transferase (WecB/TagA/CpsF family)
MNTATTSNETQTPKSAGGMLIGQSATDLVGFYGATPIAQRSGAAQAAVATTAATTTTPYGFTTLTQANAIVTLVNELRAAMVAAGLIAGA